MSEENAKWDEFAVLASRIAGIDLPPDIEPQILAHFAILAEHASRVMAVELDDGVEPAPVFKP